MYSFAQNVAIMTAEQRIVEQLMGMIPNAPWWNPWAKKLRVKTEAMAKEAATMILEGSIAAQIATAALLKEKGQPIIPEYIGLDKTMSVSSSSRWEGIVEGVQVVVTRLPSGRWTVSSGKSSVTGADMKDMFDLISAIKLCGVPVTRETLNRHT